MKYIHRQDYYDAINKVLRIMPICAILGPRQCGKTTIARLIAENYDGKVSIFDLEDPEHLNAIENPKLLLEPLEGLIIIDEIQRKAELFPYLRVLVDKKPNIKILILGSSSQELIRQSTETLAGRIGYIEMMPFSMLEVDDYKKLWLRGGFPRSYLAESDEDSIYWRKEYIKTFLEKDIPSFGFDLNSQMVRKFWMMLCDYHGNIFNSSEIGRSLGIDHKTARRYLDILHITFMIRVLNPWFQNITKRQVKSPKIYFRDSGILHGLLNLGTKEVLDVSSKIGASWEGFAMEQVIRYHKADSENCFFWATQAGAEMDLLIQNGVEKLAFEFKYSSTPKITKSIISATESLELEYVTIVVPGDVEYMLDEKIKVCGLSKYIYH